MKDMVDISPFTMKVNTLIGLITSILSYALGEHWILFVALLGFNLMDFVSRWLAARLTGTENSAKGLHGIIKKLGYWLMIMVAFGASAVFIQIGDVIGVDLGITTLLGYFVLGTLIINEIRSILENLVDAGYNVPWFLSKGLEIAHNTLDGKVPMKKDDAEEKEE